MEELSATVSQLMSDVGVLDVPLLVEAGTGDNWDQATLTAELFAA